MGVPPPTLDVKVVNPLGDEVLDELGEWWAQGPCVCPEDRP